MRRGSAALVAALTAALGVAPWPARAESVVQLLRAPDRSILALTNQEGGLYASRDEGRTWDSLAEGLPSGRLFSVAAGADGTLWACSYDGVYRSPDAGRSWSEVPLPRLTLFLLPEALLARTLPRGLFLGADGGSTWSAVGGSVEELHVTAATRAGSDVWLGAFGGGVHRSADGRQWQAENDGLANTDVLALGVGSGGALLAGTFRGGAYRREPGAVWQRVDGLPEDASVQAFASDRETLAAGTHDHGLFLSDDDGRSWNPVGDDGAPRRVTTMLPAEGGWLVGSLDAGLSRLSAATRTWTRVSLRHDVWALHRTPGGRVYAGLGDGRLLRADQRGEAFRDVTPLPGAVRAILGTRGGRLLAGTAAGAFASDDAGATWSPVGVSAEAEVLSWAETASGHLLAGTDAGLFRAEQDREWRQVVLPTEPNYFFDLAVGPRDACYAATEHGFAFSADAGRTWSEEHFIYGLRNVLATADGGVTVAHRNGLFSAPAGSLEFETQEVAGMEGVIIHHWDHPVELPDESLLMADGSGVVRVAPTGPGTWQTTLRSLAHADVRALLVLPDGALLAGTDKGLFRSRDAGTTWNQVALP